MNAPNAAVGALPGWRGTDPDGGTWVLTAANDPAWAEITSEGLWAWRSQEEAEAAGLVRLIPAVGYHYDERGEDVVPDAVFGLTDAEVPTAADSFVRCTEEGPNGQCDQDARTNHRCARKGNPIDPNFEHYADAIAPAAPAPLDPGNPEHLRPIVAALRTIEKAYPPGHCDYETIRCARSLLDSEADRLDREQREAQARLERNPQAVEAIRQAEKDLTEGRAVTVEVQSASGTYLNEVDASVAPEYREALDALTAPAPLDPGNPEHLRQVADLFPYVRGYAESPHHAVALSARDWLEAEADRLDREQREAEQDAEDRKRAEEIARERANGEGGAIGGWDRLRHDIREWHIGIAIDAIRAERARQAVGQ